MAALSPDCRVKSVAHVVAIGHGYRRGRLRMVVAHVFVGYLAAPAVVCCMDRESCFRERDLGRRGVHQVIVGLYPLLRRTWVSAP